MTRVYLFTNLFLSLTLCFGLTACNQEDFFEKEELVASNPNFPGSTTGSTDGGTVGGTDGSTDGGTVGGTDGGTVGGTDGGTVGGTDGGTVGGTDGGTVGGTDGGTVGGTDGGTDGGTTGVVYENKTELFQQTASSTKKLDILWVIDDSGSMADEQKALGDNFGDFINDFINMNVDFKMAITTTDVTKGKKGRVVPNSIELLTSAKAANEEQFKNDFKSLIKVGTKGSAAEKGLEATEGFLDNPQSTSFLRPDAYLAVVIVSDELDQSPKSVDQYVNLLTAKKANAGLVKIYTIVELSADARYRAASNKTGGSVMDIKSNFASSLTDMGNSIENLLDSFALANTPVTGSLKVFVDGIQTSVFTYDASTRSIKFHAPNLPSVGSEIKVQYKVEK